MTVNRVELLRELSAVNILTGKKASKPIPFERRWARGYAQDKVEQGQEQVDLWSRYLADDEKQNGAPPL